jgi:hypothetical protein
MKTLRALAGLLIFVIAGAFMMVSQAHAAYRVEKINAKGAGQILGGGNTEADIIAWRTASWNDGTELCDHRRLAARLP